MIKYQIMGIYHKSGFFRIVGTALLGSFLFSASLAVNPLLGYKITVFGAEDLAKTCQTLLDDENGGCGALSREKCQETLNKCLEFYQSQSSYYGGKVTETQAEAKTLQNKISILKNKISGLNNEIYRSNLMIKDLNMQIGDTQASIGVSSVQIEDSKSKLAELLRTIYEQDQRSLLEIMLAENELSDFFDELAALEALNIKNQELLGHIKSLKVQLEDEETALTKEKGELEQLIVVRTLQKQESQSLQKEQGSLLKTTKGREDLYQAYLKETQTKASEVRKKIFQLAQVSEEEAPSYEEAYALAEYVETVTGVRPALLLGLLQTESAIGKNVGQCNCPTHFYCRYPDIGYKEVMHSGQWGAFLEITDELGMNPDTTPISCSISGGKVQWGGAMGPAQFMPNTWLNPSNPDKGYKKRVENIIGGIANPWRVKDAFLAAGLYLSDWGAGSQKLQKEVGAVTAYLCGTNVMTTRCKTAGGYSYRNQVMENASEWEKWIEGGVF